MKIFVDADACPVVRIVEGIAKKYQVYLKEISYILRNIFWSENISCKVYFYLFRAIWHIVRNKTMYYSEQYIDFVRNNGYNITRRLFGGVLWQSL